MMKRNVLRLCAALTLLLFALPMLAPSAQAQTEPRWSRVVGLPDDIVISAIDMVNPAVAWGAGSRLNAQNNSTTGVLVRLVALDGIWTWTAIYAAPQQLTDVVAVSADEAWAVGLFGSAMHLVGTNPTFEVLSNEPGTTLPTIARDGDAIVVAGSIANRPLVARRDTRGWQTLPPPPLPQPSAMVYDLAVHNGTISLLGEGVFRYAAGQWTTISPAFCTGTPTCRQAINAIAVDRSGTLVAVGERFAGLPGSPQYAFVGVYDGTTWQEPLGTTLANMTLDSIVTADDGTLLAVGTGSEQIGRFAREGLVLQRTASGWQRIPLPRTVGALSAAAATDSQHALVTSNGQVLTYGYPYQAGLALDVRSKVEDPRQPGVRFFPETGHTLRGEFRNRWEASGGLAQFGFPITEEVPFVNPADGRTYLVQYFERARFELHPDLPRPFNVLLGLLGRDKIVGRENEPPFVPRADSGPGYAPETGHTIAPEFYGYWQQRGGLAIFGYPLSEAFIERNPADGRDYLVQYFERNRFEYHPELPEPYRVSLGLLGNESLNRAIGR